MALSVTSELGIRSQAAEWSVLLPVLNIISFQVRPRGVLSLRTQCGSQLSKVSTRGYKLDCDPFEDYAASEDCSVILLYSGG